MKIFLLTILAFTSLNAYTIQPSTENIKNITSDQNGDGKTDRIETYENNQLKKVAIDSNYQGQMNEWITYFSSTSPDQPIETREQDTNGDKKIDRIEKTYQDPSNDLLIITTTIDPSFNGIFSRSWTSSSKLIQKKDQSDCVGQVGSESPVLLKLIHNVDSAKYILEKGFYNTNWGYKIHQSCLDKWGARDFPNLLKSSLTKGLQCLERLAKENIKQNPKMTNGASNNLQKLNSLLKTNGVSIVCNEKNYNWTDTAAHASTSPNEVIKELGVKHPFISLNTNSPKTPPKATSEENEELMLTLFHEQLHNLGIRHNENIEFPYACETCCVKKEEGEKTLDACKICSGGYSGTNDKNYLIDLIKWGKSSDQSDRAAAALVKFQKEYPQDRFGLFAFADASSGIFSPVGVELGKLLKDKFLNLSNQELHFFNNSQEFAKVKNLKAVSPLSKVIAQSYISLYYDKNKNTVLDQLEKNKSEIKTLLQQLDHTQDNNKYIYGEMKNKVANILKDIWLDGYPKNTSPQCDRAYKMLSETGLLKSK